MQYVKLILLLFFVDIKFRGDTMVSNVYGAVHTYILYYHIRFLCRPWTSTCIASPDDVIEEVVISTHLSKD